MDAQGHVTDIEDDEDHNDLEERHSERNVFATRVQPTRHNNLQDRIPTFAEHVRTQRRAKKWDAIMGRWSIPEQKSAATASKKRRSTNTTTSTCTTSGPPKRAPPAAVATVTAAAAKVPKAVHRRKVVTRLRKGVPDHVRGQVWQYLARVPQKMKVHKGLYHRLVQQAIDQHVQAAQQFSSPDSTSLTASMVEHAKTFKSIQDTIERDIHRTYPRHHLFYESEEEEEELQPPPQQGGELASQPAVSSPSSPTSSPRTSDANNNNNTTATSTVHTVASGDDNQPETDTEVVLAAASSSSSLLRNPTLRRGSGGVSPREAPQGETDKEDETDGRKEEHTDDDDDDDDEDRFQMGGFCGNEEISNMIRELEGVVAGDDAGGSSSLATFAAASAQSTLTPQSTRPSSRPMNGRNSPVLPGRVADAVGGQASLRRVLKAYSVYDREIGYCQGMNFVAGMFLTLMPEEEAFWLLVSVMNEEPCRMRGLFGEGMRETHLVLHVAERLIQLHLPKIYKQLDKEHVHITMFATQWLLTQYTSSFRFDLVLRVWDAFLGEGWKVTYRVMLALLKLHETQLLQSSFEDVLTLVRELPDRVNGNDVLELALQIPLRRQTIQKLETEWQTNHAPPAQPSATVSASSSGSSKPKKQHNSNNKGAAKPGTTRTSPPRKSNPSAAGKTVTSPKTKGTTTTTRANSPRKSSATTTTAAAVPKKKVATS